MMFSVVIPIHNRAHLVGPLLKSLAAKSFDDFEIVMVDDGSTDDLEAALAALTEPRLRLIRQANAGGGAARNAGIDAARGRYVAFLDSDDVFLPNKLERMAAAIAATGATMLFSQARVERGDGASGIKPTRGPHPDEAFEDYLLVARQPVQSSTLVVETGLARRVRFDPALRKFQDIDFALRLAQMGARLHFVPEVLSIWTDSTVEGRVGSRRDPKQAYDWLDRHGHTLGRRAFHGFRANLLSYEIGSVQPFRASYYIGAALLAGGVSPRRAAHSQVRALLPQRFYRPLVDWWLRFTTPRSRR